MEVTKPEKTARKAEGGQRASSREGTSSGRADVDSSAEPLRWPETSGEKQDLHEVLRKFHFTGERPGCEAKDALASPLLPAVCADWLEPSLRWLDVPLFLPAVDGDDDQVLRFAALLTRAADELETAGTDMGALREHFWRLSRAAGRVLDTRGGSGPMHEVFAEASNAFLKEMDGLQTQLDQLAAKLPKEGTLLGPGNHPLLALYANALCRHRRLAREKFCGELKTLVPQLEDRLRLERMHTPEGSTPTHLAAAMGEAAGRYVDAEALAGAVRGHRGTKHMTPEHRQRIVECVELLQGYMETAETGPEFVLVHSGNLPEGLDVTSAAVVEAPDCFAAAAKLFDEAADEMVPIVRALRLARLEVANQYQPSLHDEPLAGLDRESLAAEELTLARAVVVLETAQALQGPAVVSYSKLLQSSRPIHVLVLHDAIGHDEEDAGSRFSAYDPSLGYRTVAHREAYVLQSTLAEPEHLAQGLKATVQAVRPGVAFVGGSPWTDADAWPWLQAVAEHKGRASPCFHYAPDAGDSWATTLTLSHNPRPEAVWPSRTVHYLDDGADKELDLPISFAECAALDARCREHFCVIPATAWDEEQVPLPDYLNKLASELPREMPFIWVVDQDRQLQRALLTRELALACRDRMRSWRILQELGGIHNEYARRAAERSREEAQEEAETSRREMGEARVAEEEKLRHETMQDTVNRLVAGLLGLEKAPAPAAATPVQKPQDTQPSPTGPVVEEESAAERVQEAAPIEDPYIDSSQCTTCDDCININPKLFQYDENKQAYIADVTAGTFAQLVKAAAKCPAACIHPGTPRPGDATATDKLVAKAAEFN